ncbi:hypothetical protein ACFX2J_032302 [Malus domestica]
MPSPTSYFSHINNRSFEIQSNGFKDHCIDRMEQSARRNFMHSFASKRPRVPTFLAELRALVLTSPSVCLLNG